MEIFHEQTSFQETRINIEDETNIDQNIYIIHILVSIKSREEARQFWIVSFLRLISLETIIAFAWNKPCQSLSIDRKLQPAASLSLLLPSADFL